MSDALEAFQNFHSEMSLCCFKLQALKSDNDGEYCNKLFSQFCNTNNIVLRYTPPHSPNSNADAERYNRVLLEWIRVMLSLAKLPRFI